MGVWTHVQAKDHDFTTVTPAAYGSDSFIVGLAVATVPTEYKNFSLRLFAQRAGITVWHLAVFCAPGDLYSVIGAAGWNSSFLNEYSKYIWAHQTFIGGYAPTANVNTPQHVNVELNTVTKRKLDIGDQIFWVLWCEDQNNNAAATAEIVYDMEYDYNEVG